MLNATTPYYLDIDGVDVIKFIKQANPPLASFDKGYLYELTDGKLYFNGNELGGIPVGNVSGPDVSVVNTLTRWDNTNGLEIKDSSVSLSDTGDLSGVSSVDLVPAVANPGDASTVWVNSGDSKLYLGADAIGGVAGPVSSVENNIALFADASGDVLKATSLKLTAPLVFKQADDTNLLTVKNNLSVSLGLDALADETTGIENTAIGDSALNKNTSGIYNTAIGCASMFNGTTGGANVAVGTYSAYNLNGNNNTVLGYYAMRSATSVNDTVAVGRNCLDLLTTGDGNICVGNYAGRVYTTEGDNICVGNNGTPGDSAVIRIGTAQEKLNITSLVGIDSGITKIGFQAGLANNTGARNTAIGSGALSANTSGSDNTAVGVSALALNVIGLRNTAVGKEA